MARFEVLYNTGRRGLDKVIEAVQVRRMADDEAADDEEDDLPGKPDEALAELPASSDDILTELVATLPDDTELLRRLAEIPEVDLSGLPEFDVDAILKSLDE